MVGKVAVDPTLGDFVGTSKLTGKLLYGLDHCVQSIWDILTTRINTRVMLLDYRSDGSCSCRRSRTRINPPSGGPSGE